MNEQKGVRSSREIIKSGDFVEVEYIGRDKETGDVFDTTSLDVAKEQGLYDDSASYGPVVVCVGKAYLLKGLEEALVGKKEGTTINVVLPPEKAFGGKSAKLIQLISTAKFRSQGIVPVPGLRVNVDNMVGVVKTVTGGRTLVDFNHPLSGRTVEYEVKINRIVKAPEEKVRAVLNALGIEAEVRVEAQKAVIKVKQKIPGVVREQVINKVLEQVQELKSAEFSEGKSRMVERGI